MTQADKAPISIDQALSRLGKHSFEHHIFDLYTGIERDLRTCIFEMAEEMGLSHLKGPLFTMTHELAANGLKAMYKKVYYEFFVREIGLDYVSYEDWLRLFRTEIEAHQAENFARLCRNQDMYVTVRGSLSGANFRIEIINVGTPSEIELERLNRSIETARNADGPAYFFLEDDDDEEQKEGGGIGLVMLITSLKNMGINPDAFSIKVEGEHTRAVLDLPTSFLVSALTGVAHRPAQA